MRAQRLFATPLLCITLTACGTSAADLPIGVITSPVEPATANKNSLIVSAMDNQYQENSELAVDPCHDSFIHNMETLGYTLDADVILPEGREQFDYWFASCDYKSNTLSVLLESATAPYMRKNQTLSPTNVSFGRAHMIDIHGRDAIARPVAVGNPTCILSIDTSFGSMTLTGGPRINTDQSDPCGKVEQLARQIEPWIDD